jgi:exodeoxyribonuclease-3
LPRRASSAAYSAPSPALAPVTSAVVIPPGYGPTGTVGRVRLATWNVNSIRTRVDRVTAFLERTGTDVLAMQETKCRPDQFPVEPFASLGYEIAAHGHDQWNGVAIASRIGLSDVETSFPGQPEFGKTSDAAKVEARAIGATCGDIRVWSVYVPHGRGLDDPHFAYKTAFLRALADAARGWADGGRNVAVVADWNVIPLDTDVWDPSLPELATHVCDEARDALAAMATAGYEEVSRRFAPDPHRYTYWSYQDLRFPRGEGMRIDFVYGSPALAARASAASIERDERKGTGASDHVPVVVDFAPAAGTVEP